MSNALIISTIILAVLQFSLPKKIAYLPMLIAVFHLGNFELTADLTAIRILILLGLVRAIPAKLFRYRLSDPFDLTITFICCWMIMSSFFHEDPLTNPFIYRLGQSFNILGSYLYARAYLPDFSRETVTRFCLWLSIVIIPFAALLATEKATARNSYSAMGARKAFSNIREDKVRAQGTFGHAILAGTAGATCLPLAFYLFRRKKKRLLGILAIGSCIAIVISSASSGPLASLVAAVLGLYMWRWKASIGVLIKLGITAVIFLHLIMTRNVWHLMSMMDLVGGSTGWHRARLIDKALENFGDWWLFGTDYTRHWMPTGVSWNPNHTDITNNYLILGVVAGAPAVIALIVLIIRGLRSGLLAVKNWSVDHLHDPFAAWCLLVSLTVHAISFISIAYFDQSFVLFYTVLALLNNAKDAIMNGDESELVETEGEKHAVAH